MKAKVEREPCNAARRPARLSLRALLVALALSSHPGCVQFAAGKDLVRWTQTPIPSACGGEKPEADLAASSGFWDGSALLQGQAPDTSPPLEAALEDLQREQLSVGYDTKETTRWLRPEGGPARAVALVVHGLNIKPSKMDPISGALRESGVEVLRVTLSGHGGDPKEMRDVTRQRWLADLARAYRIARERALSENLPLHFVGFSLGALVNLDLMNSSIEPVSYDRMVLFAPGIAFHPSVLWMTRLVTTLLGWYASYAVPNSDKQEYRVSRGTTMAAFNAVRDSLSNLKREGLGKSDIPTVVLLDPEDKVVDKDGIERLLRHEDLSQWKLVELQNPSLDGASKSRHLIIDKELLGPEVWKTVLIRMREHLGLGGTEKPQAAASEPAAP